MTNLSSSQRCEPFCDGQWNVRVVEGSDVDPEVVETHALGAILELETFDGVHPLVRSPPNGVSKTEEEDECNFRVSCSGGLRDADTIDIDNVGG